MAYMDEDSFKASVNTVFNVQSAAFADCRIFVLLVSADFCDLDVPVTELIPDEIVYFLYGDTELELVHILGCIFCQCIDFGNNPLICWT